MPLSNAPSTFGLTQKSPQMATLFIPSQMHLSSLAMLAAGKALPLQYINTDTQINLKYKDQDFINLFLHIKNKYGI